MKKLSLIYFIAQVLLVNVSTHFAQAQNINTIAGDGTEGYSGDGGSATAAELTFPYAVSVDGLGNVYIADNANNCIRRVSPSGIISTFAGNGTLGSSGDGGAATAAELNSPYGVAVDGSGNVYIADGSNNRIRKVNASGVITTIAGNGTAGYSGDGVAATAAELWEPFGVAVDGSGNVYIADYDNQRIRKVNSSGIISTIAGTGTAGSGYSDGGPATAALILPIGIAVDGSGNVYIADVGIGIGDRIRKVNTSGIISTIAGTGTEGYSGDGGVATAAELYFPTGIAVDGSGNVYIADFSNNRIRKVNTSGIISTIAGTGISGFSGDGGAATAAEFTGPSGVAIAADGNLYIADQFNNRIRGVAAVGTGVNSVLSVGVGVSVSVYPNPATHQITITTGQTISNIAITNLLGQTIFSNLYNATQVQVDVADLPAGVYIIRINGSEVRKFVKQ